MLYNLFCLFHFVLLSSCGWGEGSSGIYFTLKGPFGAEKGAVNVLSTWSQKGPMST